MSETKQQSKDERTLSEILNRLSVLEDEVGVAMSKIMTAHDALSGPLSECTGDKAAHECGDGLVPNIHSRVDALIGKANTLNAVLDEVIRIIGVY